MPNSTTGEQIDSTATQLEERIMTLAEGKGPQERVLVFEASLGAQEDHSKLTTARAVSEVLFTRLGRLQRYLAEAQRSEVDQATVTEIELPLTQHTSLYHQEWADRLTGRDRLRFVLMHVAPSSTENLPRTRIARPVDR